MVVMGGGGWLAGGWLAQGWWLTTVPLLRTRNKIVLLYKRRTNSIS